MKNAAYGLVVVFAVLTLCAYFAVKSSVAGIQKGNVAYAAALAEAGR